ncbi:uncharacterized protein LOC129313938 [Prosopis cineraria]|uniref:uncharacterized protein LOC129313938 n=1 Tax=Prosopis cineraria TaxID=364024 RepID=UPI00240FCD5A|nr:uncharacterized protein LOC129313938 [Prosopis cineraria]
MATSNIAVETHTFSCKITQKQENGHSFLHFTDLIRYLCLPYYFDDTPFEYGSNNTKKSESGSTQIRGLKSAAKLKKARINFKPVHDRSLIDIRFNSRNILSGRPYFEFPKLIIDDSTEVIFQNIIAFEQFFCKPNQHHFSAYVRLLRDLIDTPEDVALLADKDVLVHTLDTNEEVVTLFNKLSKGLVVKSSTYNDLIERVKRHYDSGRTHFRFAAA